MNDDPVGEPAPTSGTTEGESALSSGTTAEPVPTCSTTDEPAPTSGTTDGESALSSGTTAPSATTTSECASLASLSGNSVITELVKIPVRVRKQGRKHSRLPSYRLTSDAHYDFVLQKTTKKAGVRVGGNKKENKRETKAKGSGKRSKHGEEAAGGCKAADKPIKRRRKATEKTVSSRKLTDGDHTPCSYCRKRYNTAEDDKPEDDWLQCFSCHTWMHETCAEEGGVIGDDDFICQQCVN